MNKIPIGVIGATGYVGQRFVQLLQDHPYFELVKLAASKSSAGKTYRETLEGRQMHFLKLIDSIASIRVEEVTPETAEAFAQDIRLVFCAVDMAKEDIIALEEALARAELVVISNNSANRMTEDVPMLIPEINIDHLEIIESQRERLGSEKGFILCKPNCSIQSYVPALHALREFGIEEVFVSTYQAISGAGKTFETWPEARDNVIPFISGEEEKSEREPMKIWGKVQGKKIESATNPKISAHCYRVGVEEGHMAAVTVKFTNKPSPEEILQAWETYSSQAQHLNLPHAPQKFLHYMEAQDRPQSKLDAQNDKGMGVMISRLRPDHILDYKFTCLSNNTLRGAAGGAVLSAELLYRLGYLD